MIVDHDFSGKTIDAQGRSGRSKLVPRDQGKMFADVICTRIGEERRRVDVLSEHRLQYKRYQSCLGKKDVGCTCFVSTNAKVFTEQ